MHSKVGKNKKIAADICGLHKEGNSGYLSIRKLLNTLSFFHRLCWNHLRDEKGKETFLSAFPLDLLKGTRHG